MVSTGGKLLICPPELSGNPTSRVIAVNQEEFGEGNDEFSLRNISVYTSKCAADFYRP
jgi:hypothetical protein